MGGGQRGRFSLARCFIYGENRRRRLLYDRSAAAAAALFGGSGGETRKNKNKKKDAIWGLRIDAKAALENARGGGAGASLSRVYRDPAFVAACVTCESERESEGGVGRGAFYISCAWCVCGGAPYIARPLSRGSCRVWGVSSIRAARNIGERVRACVLEREDANPREQRRSKTRWWWVIPAGRDDG